MKITTTFFFIITFLFLQGCVSTKNIDFYFQEINEASKDDIVAEKAYYKSTSQNRVRKKDEVLIVFNGEAFKKSYVVLNKSDTIHFKESSNNCMGAYLVTQKKSAGRIHLSTPQKESIVFKIKKDYNYIKVNGSSENRWAIVYSKYFPLIVCE